MKIIYANIKVSEIILNALADATEKEELIDIAAYHATFALRNILRYYLKNDYCIDMDDDRYDKLSIKEIFELLEEIDKTFHVNKKDLVLLINKIEYWTPETIQGVLQIAKKYAKIIDENQKDYRYKFAKGIIGNMFIIHGKLSESERKIQDKVNALNDLLESHVEEKGIFATIYKAFTNNKDLDKMCEKMTRLRKAKDKIEDFKNYKLLSYAEARLKKMQPDLSDELALQNKNEENS